MEGPAAESLPDVGEPPPAMAIRPSSPSAAAGIAPATRPALGYLRRPRRRWLPLALFIATCGSTFWAGATQWEPTRYWGDWSSAGRIVDVNWRQGLAYMTAVIGILLTHEMGHFLQTVRYHVPASFPWFLPMPVLMTGTMGAVIGMEGSRADRKQLFDIGISGPWAGLLVALPVAAWGILVADRRPHSIADLLYDPLIFRLLQDWLRPDLPAGAVLAKNPLLMAGWVGMLVTGLNMLPISQLDGGHVVYGLFGRRGRWIPRAFACAAIATIVFGELFHLTLILVLVILMGIDHPPTRDDRVRLGFWRQVLGAVSLGIPILCFTPVIV